ncbi:MAG: tetratricopeptide repeat protein [candidate division Zixibacteria bacterium]|nr:tetratricopeptide repeat protein [candidate division Zixibacteria bacterium]
MALKLDNTLAEAHASLGLLKTEHEWDWLGAEKEFKQAIGLNPACVTAHYWYGLLLGYLGRFDEAIGEVRKALELDPLSVLIHKHMAQVLLLAGKPGEAIDILQKGMEIEPNSIFLHAMIGLAYSQKSLYEEALTELLKEKKIFVNSPPVIDAWIGDTYAVMGRKDKVQEILNDLLTRSESEYVPPSWLARLYFALEEKEEGFKWLEKAYEKKDTWLRYLRVYRSETFSPISSDPRFIALMKKMGLEK